MSELMDGAVIKMPYEMAMSDELSRRQFYSRAQCLMKERDAYRDLCFELIEDMKNAIEYQKNGLGSIRSLQVSIDKAEQLLGEKN